MRVDFFWLGDRFGHVVSVVRDGGTDVVWRSVHESQYSPVFQELHEQVDSDGRKVLFLSGAGGGAHWSMSVEQDSKAICFDTAARVTTPPPDRVIEYLAEFTRSNPDILLCHSNGVGSADLQEQCCTLRPQQPVGGKMPVTLRWRYAAL